LGLRHSSFISHSSLVIRHSIFAPLLVASLVASARAQQAKPADPAKPSEAVTYRDHVLPILRKHCINCHNPDKATSDLNVTTYQTLMAGGSSGEPITPGSPDQSLLYSVVAHIEEPHMPPKQPRIPDAELAVIKKWIELGAPETAAGAAKAAARSVAIDVTTASSAKPDGPPPMPPQDMPTRLPARTPRDHPVTALAASPWAPLLAVSGHECILLYHTDTLELLGVLPFPERVPHVLKFSRNGKLLLAAGGQGAAAGRVVLFDVPTGQRLTEIGEELDVVLAADISANHKYVALGGPSKLIKIYETTSGELRHRIKKHTDWVTAMEFNPEGDMLATGDRGGGAYVWEAESGSIVFTLGDHRESVTNISWRADSQMLATSSEDGRVILWFAEDGFPTRTINAHADTPAGRPAPARARLPGVLFVEYARGGQLATVGRDNSARIWRPDGNQQAKLTGFTDLPNRVVFSHDGQRVFAGDFIGKVRAWNLKDNQPAGELSTNPD
jgi:mono/diheme cytochrome c family protein